MESSSGRAAVNFDSAPVGTRSSRLNSTVRTYDSPAVERRLDSLSVRTRVPPIAGNDTPRTRDLVGRLTLLGGLRGRAVRG
jgi:hypothetical protein